MAETFLLVAADFVKTGGMDRANYAVAEYLAERGAEVHLVGHSAGEGLRTHARVRWHPVKRPFGHDALGWGRLARAGQRWARRIRQAGGRVLVNGGNCAWGDLNWVHYVHAAYATPLAGGAGRQLWQRYKHARACRDERRALSLARVIVANSERTRQDLIERLGLAADRVHTIYYGCDAGRFHPVDAAARRAARVSLGWEPERRVALFVGALGDRRKGFDTTWAAWQRLCARPDWDVDLVVAGRGLELEAWRERVRMAGLAHRCRLLGFRRDVPTLLAASDVLLSPTRYEAYGLGVHEALCCAVPALVSAQAGVAERYPAGLEAWLLRDPESSEELERRLLAWRADSDRPNPELEALGERLRSESWNDMAERIVALAEPA